MLQGGFLLVRVVSDLCNYSVLMIIWNLINLTKVFIFLMGKMVVCGSILKFLIESKGGFRPNATKFLTTILSVIT